MLDMGFVGEAYRPAVSDGRARFPENIKANAPLGMSKAVSVAAGVQSTTNAEYMRRAILTALALDGVTLLRGQVVVVGGA